MENLGKQSLEKIKKVLEIIDEHLKKSPDSAHFSVNPDPVLKEMGDYYGLDRVCELINEKYKEVIFLERKSVSIDAPLMGTKSTEKQTKRKHEQEDSLSVSPELPLIEVYIHDQELFRESYDDVSEELQKQQESYKLIWAIKEKGKAYLYLRGNKNISIGFIKGKAHYIIIETLINHTPGPIKTEWLAEMAELDLEQTRKKVDEIRRDIEKKLKIPREKINSSIIKNDKTGTGYAVDNIERKN